jgi:hypothetical protein
MGEVEYHRAWVLYMNNNVRICCSTDDDGSEYTLKMHHRHSGSSVKCFPTKNDLDSLIKLLTAARQFKWTWEVEEEEKRKQEVLAWIGNENEEERTDSSFRETDQKLFDEALEVVLDQPEEEKEQ